MTRRNEDDQGDWDNQYRMTVIPRNNTGMTSGEGGGGWDGWNDYDYWVDWDD